jgi:hypothetical protein
MQFEGLIAGLSGKMAIFPALLRRRKDLKASPAMLS